eukprot:CAMPEP_0175841366 /NCGR_PEP_ID=MMETSP0107_2-20121207/19896_1 /TAXON_ID=195067 ORGANISM="Goniomonas pacifica, Strain CCMP1869" /NCGR_SAMPLE_ID=MMETSP0107_2 /ASSEMBLY_ACC=CAM_ASM_000203 /LENGTH=43 /DNA_ID= /DNA_START= /DNA_END= /DNA_ORIENTATION=
MNFALDGQGALVVVEGTWIITLDTINLPEIVQSFGDVQVGGGG